MRLFRPLLLSALLPLALAATPADAAKRRVAAPRLTVIPAGSDQALKLGGATLSRPFGGTLVDRMAVVGEYQAAGQSLWLVRGEAAGTCAAHYLIVVQRRGQSPSVSSPFGTCSPAATARVQRGELIVTMPDAAGTPAGFAWRQGAIRPLDAGGAVAMAAPASLCAAPIARTPELLDAALVETLPDELRRGGGIRRADLAPDDLQAIVADLACLSTWPGADNRVPQAATSLFASKRYGRASFAALDTVARTPESDPTLRAAVRAFSARMYYAVGRREPL